MKFTLIALHYGEEGSGGARRSYLWAKGLRQAGHEVHVVSPYVKGDHPHEIFVPFGARGSNMHSLPTSKAGLFETWIKLHFRIWLRWPDPEITWHRKIVNIVKENINSCDWVITSSPPESAHAIGAQLAKSLEARWCVELRDSWIERSHRHYIRGLRRYIEKQCAKRWLKKTDVITSVNAEIVAEAFRLAPHAPSANIGHFSEAFSAEPFPLPSHTFNLVHAGGFTRSDRRRSLPMLLKTLTPIFLERTNLHLHLMGPLTLEEAEILKSTNILFTYHGWVSLSKSRAIQAAADAVLLYTPLSGSTALPGKYAEYCNLRKPIFYYGAEQIKNMAHRKNEFLELNQLISYPKGQIMSEEKDLTVERAVQDLLKLLRCVNSAK